MNLPARGTGQRVGVAPSRIARAGQSPAGVRVEVAGRLILKAEADPG
jgi:hypothetical protein